MGNTETDTDDVRDDPGEEAPSSSTLVTVRAPSQGWRSLNLIEVWHYRELLQLFVWRNIIVRYKQSVAGIAWAVMRPVTQMVILSFIFGKMAKLDSEGVPYPLYTFVALLPWNYFSGCLRDASNSLVTGASIAKKVYFPRLIFPLSNLFTGLVDFAVSLVVLIGLMVWYWDSIDITWGVACLPLLLLLAMVTAFAVSLWMSALMVKYRDVRHVLPFVIQIWMYLSPVAYAAKLVGSVASEGWCLVYSLNPMVGVINGFRWALLGQATPDWPGLLASIDATLILLVTGLYYFRRTERTFADIV